MPDISEFVSLETAYVSYLWIKSCNFQFHLGPYSVLSPKNKNTST